MAIEVVINANKRSEVSLFMTPEKENCFENFVTLSEFILIQNIKIEV